MRIKSMFKRLTQVGLALVLGAGLTFATAAPASATAQTCISAPGGYVCTVVYGSGTWVGTVGVSRGKYPGAICNYSVWFYYVPPGGGAYGLGYHSRGGCTPGRVWFEQGINRSFPRHTLVCAKFMENFGQPVGEKCVGLS